MKLAAFIPEISDCLIKKKLPEKIDSAVILGSGLGSFSDVIEDPVIIPYSDIPAFPATSVQGHNGELIFGKAAGKTVLAFSGRFHHYEGHEFSTTVLPVQLAKKFRVDHLIVSNAAGSINTSFQVGDLMVIDDIFRPFHSIAAFPGKQYRYNLYPIAGKVRKLAANIGLDVQRGTYLFAKGPNYETKAEIRAFRILGADVVGMSTAPELMEASRLGVKAAAVSMITNMAAGVETGKLDHAEVKKIAESRKDDFARLVLELIKHI